MTEANELVRLQELIKVNSRRLHILRLRVGQEGRDARPEDQMEIENIQQTLENLRQQQREFETAQHPIQPEQMARAADQARALGERIGQLGERLPSTVGFLNRLNELQEIKVRLSLPGYPPVTVISGPMGYGKTYLLQEVAHDLETERGDYALVECETLGEPGEKNMLRSLVSQLGCDDATDWEQIGTCLGKRVPGEDEKYRVILLVDGLDWLAEDIRRQVLLGLQTLHECVKEARGECHSVLSGRSIDKDLAWLTEENFVERSLPFGQPGSWYSEIPLSEFGQHVIVDLIRRVAKRDFEPWEYEVMGSNLLEITGGHPKGLVDIVTQDLDKKKAWTFGRRPGTKRFYFTPRNKERLFATYMADVVEEMKFKIGKEWWEDFQSVCVQRRFNVSILEHLIKAGVITNFASGEELLGWLARRHLIREKPPAMWGDAIARGVVVAGMRMTDGSAGYGALNQQMADSFSESLNRLRHVYLMMHTPELEAYIIAYGTELMYHRLEAIKYLESSEKPQKPIEKVSEEIRTHLVSLGDETVRKFVEEVGRDNEICPSKEDRDVVARTLSARNRTGGER